MAKQKQPTYLAITPKGEKYLRQLVEVGYVNLPLAQRVEWNILHDFTGDPIPMQAFLAEGRDTILGRTFARLSERTQGQLAIEGYGKTLHSLIKQSYIRAFRLETPPKEV